MSIKQKLLSVLDICIADISEETLLQILLDLYEQRRKKIIQLEGENVSERLMMIQERENIKAEYHRIRSDPTLLAEGEYYFYDCDTKFCVIISHGKVEMCLKKPSYKYEYRAIPMKREEYEDNIQLVKN